MHAIILPWSALYAGQLPEEAVSVTARIAADRLDAGESYDIVLDVRYGSGVSLPADGIPAPIVQIDVPECVKLAGQVLSEYDELARNEFLQEPYERMLQQIPARIGFTLTKEPSPDEALYLNVLTYVTYEGEQHFVRRRLRVPVQAEATAAPVEPVPSDWGKDEKLLQLGDRAQPFELPRADGSPLYLEDYLGEGFVVVSTYRAFWWPFCTTQLVQLQEIYGEFEKRNAVVIAVAQEDTDLKKHERIVAKIKPEPRFEIAADLNRRKTEAYDRITAYLIDKDGKVRQIFPMLIRTRPSWKAILNEIDRLQGSPGS